MGSNLISKEVLMRGIEPILTVEQMAEVLQISRSYAYQLAHQRGFPVVRLGRVLRVPRAALEAWLEKQAEGGNGGR